MKYALHPSRVNNTARHCYSFVCGMIFGLICFGFVYVCTSVRECNIFVLLQPDDVFIRCGWNLLCISVNFVTKGGP